MTRTRRIWSRKEELLTKSREAMLSAVQIFNNPNIQFKSESFIVLSNIAWLYLLHAYFREKEIEYRYFTMGNVRRRFHKTKRGAFKYWELERCLDDGNCPVDNITKANLKFLIGLRHEIEHQMTDSLDEYLSARFQACCLNYNEYIKKLFGSDYGIDKHLSLSLQFSSIKEEHASQLREFTDLPTNISAYINDFDSELTQAEYNDIKYSYRVLYVPKAANRKGQADKVVEFIPANSPEAAKLNTEYVLLKERKKYLPSEVWASMQKKGFVNFGQYQHTQFWQAEEAKGQDKDFGVQVANTWYWYQKWVDHVEMHCRNQGTRYK